MIAWMCPAVLRLRPWLPVPPTLISDLSTVLPFIVVWQCILIIPQSQSVPQQSRTCNQWKPVYVHARPHGTFTTDAPDSQPRQGSVVSIKHRRCIATAATFWICPLKIVQACRQHVTISPMSSLRQGSVHTMKPAVLQRLKEATKQIQRACTVNLLLRALQTSLADTLDFLVSST